MLAKAAEIAGVGASLLSEDEKRIRREEWKRKQALTEAREDMRERRGYCDAWEWKYGERWNDEDAKVDAALGGVVSK